jgi:hypothetical protein
MDDTSGSISLKQGVEAAALSKKNKGRPWHCPASISQGGRAHIGIGAHALACLCTTYLFTLYKKLDSMDTMMATRSDQEIESLLLTIKNEMPLTYKEIQVKAKAFGNDVYAWVRQGLRGCDNSFWATEGGRIVGTPFSRAGVMAEYRRWVQLYGDVDVCFFADERDF